MVKFKKLIISSKIEKKFGHFQVKQMLKIHIFKYGNLEEWACMQNCSQVCGGPLKRKCEL